MWKRVATPSRYRGARPVRHVAALVVAIIAGGWLGLLLGGSVTTEIGPVRATFSVRPWPTGDTTVRLSPLGSVTFDTHDGPLQVEASVQRIRPQAAQRIMRNPDSLSGMGDRVAADLRGAVTRLIVKSALSAVAGAALFALIVYRRRWRLIVASAAGAAVFMIGSGTAAYLTFNPQSLEEPRYTGLLTMAPRVVGNVENLAHNFSQYRQQLAKLVTNVSQLYGITSGLNPYEPDPSTIRVLHVSDLHLNPAAWSIMHSVVEQFEVNVIVDTGDIVDTGTRVENRYVDEISTFDVPYVYVRGNHDSQITLQAVANEPNAVVLTGTIKKVAGLRFFGAGDPRFTPDKTTRKTPDEETLRAVGLQLAQRLSTAQPPADIAVTHAPAVAKPLDGTVPLILSGHTHRRYTKILPEGTRLMVEGSTGGSGFRTLNYEDPTPIQLSVLYFDRQTDRLQAWDAITVGGLGLSTAEITRHVVDNPGREIQPPGQSPGPTVDPSARESGATTSPGSSPGDERRTQTGTRRTVPTKAAREATTPRPTGGS